MLDVVATLGCGVAGDAVGGGTVVHATAVAAQTLGSGVLGGGTAVHATALESASEAGVR